MTPEARREVLTVDASIADASGSGEGGGVIGEGDRSNPLTR